MKILIDNSGLHSSIRPLDNISKGEIDVKGLIQLSTLLIFCEEIALIGLEESGTANRTIEILNKLKAIGIGEDVINIHFQDINSLKSICKKTAKESASELKYVRIQKTIDTVGLKPEALSPDSFDNSISFLDLINENISEEALVEMQEKYISKKVDGAIHCMFTISENLRKSLREIVRYNPNITDNQLYQLNTYLRFKLNENIGASKKMKYTPSVGRGLLLRKTNNFVISELSQSLDNAVNIYTGNKIITPSLMKYLVYKSKGNPYRMIEEALKAREKTTELRNWLMKITNETDEGAGENKFKIRENIKDLSKGLLWDLNINTPSLTDVFEVSLSYGLIPNVKISVKELNRYMKHIRQKKKLAMLTEISKETIFLDYEINLKEINEKCNTKT